jgi:ATP-dependent protease ClpP protease subunit
VSKVRPLKARISNATGGTTRVDVYDDIGAGGWFSEGLTAKSFAAQLAEVSGPLEVHINSAGGDVFDGLAIKNAIEAHKHPVTTVVDGLAASIASVIAMAGTDRVMMPGAMLMIHDAFAVEGGNAEAMRKMAQTLDEVSDNLAAVYARAAGGLPEQWRAAMKQETWYTADQAVLAGLATRVGADGAAQLPAGFDLAAYSGIPSGIAAQLRTMPVAASPEPRPRATGRVLGIESMPILDKAMPIHHTATVDEPWDGPAAVAAMPNDDAVLRYCHAWMTDEAAAEKPAKGDDDLDDQKGSYKFPHHKTKGGPANVAACRNGLARLEGSSIPESQKAGVRAHLQAHLDDANKGGDDGDGPNDHAELPHWLRDDATPVPGWLNTPAEEANQ